jgi:hypothetical protein
VTKSILANLARVYIGGLTEGIQPYPHEDFGFEPA